MFALLTVTKLSSLHPNRNIFHFVESRWGIIFILRIFRHNCYFPEAFSEPSQQSQMKLYKKTLNNRKSENILAKSSVLHLPLSYSAVYQKSTWKDYFILTKYRFNKGYIYVNLHVLLQKISDLFQIFVSFNHYFWGSFKNRFPRIF